MERVEALAITMYEYGILEEVDVELTQAWLQDLWAVGYVPPVSGRNEATKENGGSLGPNLKILDGETSVDHDGN